MAAETTFQFWAGESWKKCSAEDLCSRAAVEGMDLPAVTLHIQRVQDANEALKSESAYLARIMSDIARPKGAS